MVAALDMLAKQIKGNYDRIETWEGTYSYVEDTLLEGRAAEAHVSGNATIPLLRKVSGLIHFRIKQDSDSLYSALVPDGPPKISTAHPGGLSSSPRARVVDGSRVLERRSVVTPENFLHVLPSERSGELPEYKVGDGLSPHGTRVAYRDASDLGRDREWSDVVDPRRFFGSPRPFWRELELHRDTLLLSESDPNRAFLEGALSLHEERGPRGPVYTLTFTHEALAFVRVATFDAQVGFNLTRLKEPQQELEIGYTKFDGVWLPTGVSIETFRPDRTRGFARQLASVEMYVNRRLPEDSFTFAALGLVDGDRVVDRVDSTGALYVYKSGELVTPDEYLSSKHPRATTVLLIILIVACVAIGGAVVAARMRRPC